MNKSEFDRNWLVLGPLAVIFIIIYSWFSFTTSLAFNPPAEQLIPIFSWPDAMANNSFIDHFIEQSSFIFPESLNTTVSNIIHPRSTNVIANGSIVPTAFLGFVIIHGLIGKLIGAWLVKFLTALVAGFAVLFFYALNKKLFNKTIGLISSLLLFTLASFWYYSNLVMLPTIMFVFLAIAGFYFLAKSCEESSSLNALVCGLFLGLASIVRLTEVAWIFLVIIIVLIFLGKKIAFEKVFLFIVGFIPPIALLIYFNDLTYGSPWMFGYFHLNDGLGVIDRLPTEMQVESESFAVVRYLKLIFLPFGFSIKHIVLNFYHYFILFLWPYVALFVIGGLVWLAQLFKQKIIQRQVVYAVCSLVICLWLIFYYGSWELADKMVLKNNLIGSSYLRYWIMMNIVILPFIGWLFEKILKLRFGFRALNFILVVVLMFGLFVFSFERVYFSRGEGLLDQRKVIASAYELQKKVVSITGTESIIVNDRADKFFWPAMKVVDFNLDYTIFPELKKLLPAQTVYYLSYRPAKDMNFINDTKIKSSGLKLVFTDKVSDEYKLYKLVQIN